jgi:hypothetical protein
MYAFIYIYLNTEYRYISFVILSKVDLVTRSVYRYTKTHSVHIYRYQGLWRISLLLGIFIFCGNVYSERGIDIYTMRQETERRHTKEKFSKQNWEDEQHRPYKKHGWTPNTWKYK